MACMTARPILFYTLGLPQAGKSTMARHLSQWLGGTYLSADRVGRSLFATPTFSPAERIAVYQNMDYQTMTALNGRRSVLYDGTLTSLEQRHHLRQLAAQYDTPAIGLWLDVPVAQARQRASRQAAGRVIQPEVFDQYQHAFQVPDPEELIIKLSGSLPFGEQYPELRLQLQAGKIAELPLLVQG
jgi:predicted kinase